MHFNKYSGHFELDDEDFDSCYFIVAIVVIVIIAVIALVKYFFS